MKLLEVLRFELGYQVRRLWTWVYVVAALLMSFAMTNARGDEAQSSGVNVNAPYVVMMLMLVGTGMALLASAAFAGDAGARDPETRIAPLVYASPLDERSYVSGRLIAAFLLNLLVLTAFCFAMIAAVFIYDFAPDLVGPIKLTTYLSAFALIAVPNALLATAFLFLLSLLSRRALSSYLGGVVVLFMSIISYALFGLRLGYWGVAQLTDPLGMAVVSAISKTTTASQKNALDLWSSAALLTNRAIWLSISGIIIAITHWRFRFETAGASRWWRRSVAVSPAEIRDRSVSTVAPKGEKAGHVAVRLAQYFSISAQSFREIAISWGGLVLVILSFITAVLGAKAMSHFGVPILTTTQQMIGWIGHPGEIIWFIAPILSVFYAGELVWRDRDTRLSEIADAAPVPGWIQLVGKFSGLALLLFVYQCMLILACMIIQAQTGYYNFEPGLYVKAVLGLSLAEHLLFAGLALALHVIINQKYVAYLAIIAVYWVMSAAPSIGLENHLFVFASSPDWTYSDSSGFGPSLVPWMWFKVYWAAWVMLLCIVASLMWVRGREQGIKARLRTLRRRLSVRSTISALAMIAVIVASSGFITYNTRVLNAGSSVSAAIEREVLYERTYAKYAAVLQPKLSGVSMRAEIFPRDRKAVIHGTYTLVNRGSSPIPAIHFVPEDRLVTSSPTFDRSAKTVVNDTILHYGIYELDSPLASGDSMHVSFDVRYAPHGFTNDGSDADVVANGTAIDVLEWLPDIGYQRHRELSDRKYRAQHGLGPREDVASLDDTAARYTGNPGRIAFDAVVSTDADQTAIAPGELRRTWTANGRRYFHYVADAPIRNDINLYSARYAIRSEDWNGVSIQVVHEPAHTLNVERMVESARASLDYFTKNFGPYPYRELRFVEYPGESMTLHASPINISYQEAFAGLNPGADQRGFDLAYAVVAHEIGHQWWGNQLSPADVEGSPLLTESLAWYSAMCIVAASRGEDQLQRLLDMFHGSAWMISRGGPSLLRIYDRWAAYRKGPFAMMALREYVGEDRVNAALRRLFDRYKSAEPPTPTSIDLYAELKAVTPDSLQPLLSDLFERNTYWEVSTRSVAAEPGGNGRWRVTLDLNARKVVVDRAGAEKEVPMNDLVEIGVYGAGGEATRGEQLYRALHRIRTGSQRVTIVVNAKPVRAGIDPRYLLIDADPSNNIRVVK